MFNSGQIVKSHRIVPNRFRFQSRKTAALQVLDFIRTIKLRKVSSQYPVLAHDITMIAVIISPLSTVDQSLPSNRSARVRICDSAPFCFFVYSFFDL